MRNETRLEFNKIMKGIAKTYGVDDASTEFSATPRVEQKLMDKIVASSSFLGRINVVGVTDLIGDQILGSVAATVGKRTDTSAGDRQTSNGLKLDPQRYACAKTENDVHIDYVTIDGWAHFPDMYDRWQKYVREAMAHSRMKVGFYGESAAAVTNAVANPMGQDVNKGWIEILRQYSGDIGAGQQFMTEGDTAGQIRIGAGTDADYANLDGLVFDLKQLINEVHRDSGELVAIIGGDLLAQDKAQLYAAQGQTPTEKERVENNSVTRTYGGLPAFTVPFFPARGVMITTWSNLSIYFQRGHVRQKIEDNAKRDRIEHYNTINEAYVVEDPTKAAALEFKNVKFWNGTAWV